MTIQFRCSNCSRLLSTPEESVGKKARCPQCNTVLTVPASSTEPAAPGSAGSAPDPLGSPASGSSGQNPFGDYSGTPGMGDYSGSANPYAPPATGGYLDKPVPQGARAGLPWERLGKSLGNFWSTAKLVLTSPSEAFQMMWREGGLGDPLLFAILGSVIGGMFTAVYQSVLQAGLMGMVGNQGNQQAPFGGPGGMLGVQIVANFIGAIVGGTIGVAIGSFIGSAINHVCLYLFKGATFPYETTFRVVCYASGASVLLQVIPFCGQLVQAIASIVLLIIGFSEAHQITKGKAALAVLLPVIVCLGLAAIVFAVVLGVGGFAAMNAAQQR